MGAVIAEWLGGSSGLGVYMTRARKSFAYSDMFAVIFLVVAISLLLIGLTNLLEKKDDALAADQENIAKPLFST